MGGSNSQDIAGFPIERFRDAIQPNDEQSAALDDLANASQRAAETIRNSCPRDVALTAPSRLATMEQRVAAMRSAVSIVQPALDKFYGLLSDEQKAKITALAADQQPARREDLPSNGNCKAEEPGATDWPSELIERNVNPTDAQRPSLTTLEDGTAKAVDILKSSCPPEDARRPHGLPRLAYGLMPCSRPLGRCVQRSIPSTTRWPTSKRRRSMPSAQSETAPQMR